MPAEKAPQPLTDAKATDMIAMGTQKVPRVYFLMVLIADWADYYSTQASYLRLNAWCRRRPRQWRRVEPSVADIGEGHS